MTPPTPATTLLLLEITTMFSLGAGLYQEYFSPIQVNLLMVGVQSSGKTTVLERLKVTEFSNSTRAHSNTFTEPLRSKIFTRTNHAEDYKPPPRPRQRPVETRPPSKFGWICPPPPKYILRGGGNLSNRNLRSSDDIIFLDTTDEDETANLVKSQRAFRRGVSTVHGSTTNTTNVVTTTEDEVSDDDTTNHAHEESMLEFDVQPGKHMLALDKIRPTIGMNLGKLNIARAKIHVWDLGGRMVDLWDRYYADADAVLFVWKLDSNDSELLEAQRSIFRTVRANVDVPVIVLGNLLQKQAPVHCEPDVLYSTDSILPDTNTLVQFANPTTGEGIKSAVEGLVVKAIQARTNR